jgi:hypothetical protein
MAVIRMRLIQIPLRRLRGVDPALVFFQSIFRRERSEGFVSMALSFHQKYLFLL